MNILTHYLRMACQKAGVTWDRENEAELRSIADEVAAVARAELAQEIEQLRARLSALEAFVDAPKA